MKMLLISEPCAIIQITEIAEFDSHGWRIRLL